MAPDDEEKGDAADVANGDDSTAGTKPFDNVRVSALDSASDFCSEDDFSEDKDVFDDVFVWANDLEFGCDDDEVCDDELDDEFMGTTVRVAGELAVEFFMNPTDFEDDECHDNVSGGELLSATSNESFAEEDGLLTSE